VIHPYATAAYAHSLSHWGEAQSVPEWGCGVILRAIPGMDAAGEDTAGMDAAGTYPIAAIAADADLPGGLERLRRLGLISITLVLDDFQRPPLALLQKYFNVVRPFKTHYIRRNAAKFTYARHHRYEVARASRKVTVRPFDLESHLPEWTALYASLIRRHGLRGVHLFPAAHFEALHRMKSTTSMGAWLDDELVSAHIWVSDGTHVHSHLAASNDAGYKAGAAYAVYDASIRHFAGAELLNFGGGAGTGEALNDGLAEFKRGFANESASAYVCGAILDEGRYDELCRRRATPADAEFFPTYRKGLV
jgi:hypothetical protein